MVLKLGKAGKHGSLVDITLNNYSDKETTFRIWHTPLNSPAKNRIVFQTLPPKSFWQMKTIGLRANLHLYGRTNRPNESEIITRWMHIS